MGDSFFKAIGITPAELASVEPPPPVSSLATLPAGESERGELIAALLAPPDGRMREGAVDLAVQLLELLGHRRQALEIAERRAGADCDPLHAVRLLYREGRHADAKRIFASVQSDETRVTGYRGMPRVRVFSAVWPFVIEGMPGEMAGFLEWLQPQCLKSEWRSAVLAQRLELALHSGGLERWMVRMRWESQVARDIARRWIDPRTPEIVPDARTSLADLAWIVSIEGCTHQNAPYLRRFIDTGVGSMAERRELLHQIVDRSNRNTYLRDRILVSWMKREEEFVALIKAVMRHYPSSRYLPYNELTEIARRHPDDHLLNFIAGSNQTSRTTPTTPIVVTRCALEALERAYLSAPLLATEPESSSWKRRSLGSTVYYLPSWAEDPAFLVLYQLRERLASTRLHALVHEHEGFHKLPPAGKHRYLRAAALDIPAARIMFEVDWSDPGNDRFGDDMAFAYGSVPPPEVLDRFHEILPDIICGSPRKPVDLIAAHSKHPVSLLFQEKDRVSSGARRMLEAWHRRLAERGPEAIGRVLDQAIDLRHAQSFELLEEICGREAADHVRDARERRRINGVKAVAVARFGPPGLHGFPFGYEPWPLVRGTWPMTATSPAWINFQDAEYPRSAWLAPRYPALASILEPWRPEIDDWSARIRSILPARSVLAAGHDIALVTGDLPTDDAEARSRAEENIGRMLAESKDADFILMRASRGVSLKHAQPPEDPEALGELAILLDAPLPMRFAAMHLVNLSPDREFREMMADSLGVTGAPPHRGIDPPMEPSRQPAPDLRGLYRQALAFEDVAELAGFLASLPEKHDLSPLAFLESEDLLARFKSPDHHHLLELLRVRHDPATGTSGVATAMRPPTFKEVVRFHAFLFDQDPDAARSFRGLVIERHWSMPAAIADVLLDHGERDEAVDWLARAILVRFRPANRWAGHHRFPKPPRWFDSYDLQRYFPRDALETIRRGKLALAVAEAIESSPGEDDPLLPAFLRFFDEPCMESYERHLGSLEFPDRPGYPNRLRGHVATVLISRKETRALGEELRRIHMDRARGRQP